MNKRLAYQSVSILGDGEVRPNDSWATGLNNNELVLGPSGAGKTRGFLIPNLTIGNRDASFLVLDTKGTLHDECGPALRERGYDARQIDLAEVGGTIGWDPLDIVERDADGRPSGRDVLSVASALCPVESQREPFWDYAAANYLSAMIAYVCEAFPRELQSMSRVVRVFEECADEDVMNALFDAHAAEHPGSYAVRVHRRIRVTQKSEKTHASIMGILASKLRCLGFDKATAMFEMHDRIDFARLGHDKVAVFAKLDDSDFALSPLTSLFVSQALKGLMREADHCEGGRLPRPVRLFLDDFSNLCIPDFDKVVAVTRSREVWVTMLCQSISQLVSLYGDAGAETIIGNCDTTLVLAFQDAATASAFEARAARTPDTLMRTPADSRWLFMRGREPRLVRRIDEGVLADACARGHDARSGAPRTTVVQHADVSRHVAPSMPDKAR